MLDINGYEDYAFLFRLFEEISAIPRGSGNTAKIADYLESFAAARGLECLRDDADNVLIRKPATPGYEGLPAVILQGHSDIVAEVSPECIKDMATEGLELFRDGDFIRARGTTLGADDGVAIVYALAVLDGRCEAHPDVEVLITSNEEIGLLGASALDSSSIRARMLINIDSDEEGVFTVGCAGGVRCDLSLPVKYEECCYKNAYRVRLHGFLGGHSGIDIDKGRANAIKVMGELLNMLYPFDWSVAMISGGNADNAIPSECEAVICGGDDLPARLEQAFSRRKETFARIPELPLDELKKADKTGQRLADLEPTATLDIEAIELPASTLDSASTGALVSLLILLPSGIVSMSKSLEGLVETSLNLGIIRLSECVEASLSVRSAIGEEKAKLCKRLSEIADTLGAEYGERGSYPSWEYREESPLRERMVSLYKRMYGKEPIINVVHAGLECGILASKIEGLDSVSIGPDNYCLHSTDEHLSISSFVSVWKFISEFLKEK